MKRKFRIPLILILSLTLLSLAACSKPPKNIAETKQSAIFKKAEVENCRITANKLDVKGGAGNRFRTIGVLKKDEEVDVLGKIGDWYVIRLDNNQTGCIDSSKAKPVIKKEEKKQPENLPQEEPPPPSGDQPPKPEKPKKEEQEGKDTPGTADELTSQEKNMVDLVNKARKKNNLPSLKVDLKITKVARIKSQDMIDNDYFSHYSPTYGSPFDMLDRFEINYLQAAENIAANSSVDSAHESLMNSSGHRRNILNPDYTHIGVGIKRSDKYGYIFTQMFVSRPK